MDEFCGSKFWDWERTWYTETPELTPCFEKTVLAWIPTVFLVIFAPIDVLFPTKSSTKKEDQHGGGAARNIFSSAKATNGVILGLIQIVQLCDALKMDKVKAYPAPATLLQPTIKFFTYMAALTLSFVSKHKGVASSGVQLSFWLLVATCEFFPFLRSLRYSSNDDEGLLLLLLRHAYYPLVVFQCFLYCWADASWLHGKKTGIDNKQCPHKDSSALSRALFSWFDSLAWRGFRKPLNESNLWRLDSEDTAEVIVTKFDSNWDAEFRQKQAHGNGNENVNVVKVLAKAFGKYFLLGSFLTAIPDLLDIAAPQILSWLISFIGSNEENWKGYFYATLLLIATMVTVLTRAQYTHIVYMTGFRVKTALMSAIYRKALRISNGAQKDSAVGEVANLMSVDVQKVLEVIPYINMAWSSPLQISLALVLLWRTIGPSILAGVAVMILLIPINGVLGNLGRICQIAQMKNKDGRVRLLTEMIAGIKVLKFHAWEESFEKKVLNIRHDEVKSLKKFACLNAVNEYLWFGSQFFVVLATFTAFILTNEEHVLDAHKIFVTLALINTMTIPLTALPRTVILGVQATVSLARLNRFLNAQEVNPGSVEHDETSSNAISLDHCSLKWCENKSSQSLKNINVSIPEGSLVAVVGAVGSGKSSLIAALLGELERSQGRLKMKGQISYVAQEAWVQNGTLRSNILFGKSYDRSRYKAVVEACCLLRDLDMFPDRDETMIGERGLNLSGGQRQRISLARAVYNGGDVYLLDDPVSAVDPEVGQRIFENVIGPEGILGASTRVLVTHDVRFLPNVDRIIVMSNGEISQMGTYMELLATEGAFSKYLKEYAEDDIQMHPTEKISSGSDHPVNLPKPLARTKSFRSQLAAEAAFEESSFKRLQMASFRHSSKPPKKQYDEEKFETSSIPWSIYLEYIRAGSWKLMAPSLLMYIVYQGFSVGANASLTAWSNEPVINGTQGGSTYYLGLYATLGICQSMAFLAAALLISLGSLRASTVMHSDMLNRVLRAPMWFFDTTPAGRLICRFAKDVDVLDTMMATVVRLWVSVLVSVIATLAIILYTVPMFVTVCIPAAAVYILVQKLYIPTSRQLRRLESVTQAPVYSYFGETISGVVTIRAYRQQDRFLKEALDKIDRHQSCYFPTLIANRWLSVRLETIAGVIKFSAAFFAVMSRQTLTPGLAGLCITYAINVTFYLGQLVKSFCDLETNIVAVERVKEYCEAPQEASWKLPEVEPESSWPSAGSIQLENYKTCYREGLDLVLKGVTCSIKPGEKIGVVGRTGAGKSSLVLALFRMIHTVDGSITIDGKDISKLGLHDLRSKLTIIPQDPVLFSGTLRFNLDPLQKFTDDAIWRVVELAHLKQLVEQMPGLLDHEICGGGDFSVGQKQLICLARALLHQSKIIVLDEATASVDLETDSFIQSTIRKEFSDCTIITIAHRLKTVMDCDRIMVMEAGTIREFDSPSMLLQVRNSLFYLMARDAGLIRR